MGILGIFRVVKTHLSQEVSLVVFLGCLLQPFCGHAPANLQSVARVDAEKDPKLFGGLGAGPDPFEVVMFLVLPEASFQPAGPFLGDGARQFLALLFVLPGLALSFEVGLDTVVGYESSVLVGGINGIGPDQFCFYMRKPLCLEDRVGQTVALVEGIKTQVFHKANAVNLELVDLGAKPACRQAGSTGFTSLPRTMGLR